MRQRDKPAGRRDRRQKPKPLNGRRDARQLDMAAAGAAEGALGLARPAASGSRWRRNAARQHFSRIPEARRIIGMAAVPESLATEAIRAKTAASMAPASTAVASAVRPAEPKAT